MIRALPVLALGVLGLSAHAQQLVLPDNMNLGSTVSTANAWRATVGHFQVAYDTSHFTNAGVTSPILITRLRFRAEDGQRDLGGHVWTGVTVELGQCAVDYAAMSSTFATNRGTMGALGTTNVTLLPASGSIPNDYVIDIDLVAIGASYLYDPTTGSDLLVDISYPAPTPTTNLVPISTGSGIAATARGRMCSSGLSGATTGTLGGPATMLVDFAGTGGYAGAGIPARAERIGAGCGQGFRSFYQDFQLNDLFDLANTSITLTPDNVAAPTGYIVTSGTTTPDVTKVNGTPSSILDEGTVAHPLGFTLNYPSGTTTTIRASTNGFVWLDSAMTASDFSPAVAKLLGISAALTARVCPLWYDFHCGRNVTTHPNSGLHVMTDTSAGPGNAVCYVTWLEIGVFNQTAVAGTSVNTMQVAIHEATGVIEMRLGAMQVSTATLGITGWSPGRVGTVASMHPGPRDLSHELPLVTQADGAVHALTHNVMSRPILGSPFTMQSFNQPTGAVLGATLISFGAQQPALPLPQLASGCGVSLALAGATTYEVYVGPTGTVSATPLTFPSLPLFMGVPVYTQYAAFDGAGLVYTSNGLELTAGLN